jgi:hypothetical protein
VDMAALRNLSAYIDRLATRPAYERATAL